MTPLPVPYQPITTCRTHTHFGEITDFHRMANYSMPPPTHDEDAPDQFSTFDNFKAKAELWLASEQVEPVLQFNKTVLMLGDTGLKILQKFMMSEDDRKDQEKVFKKFRESLGNDISFSTARSTLYHNFQQQEETIHELDIIFSKLIDKCAFRTDKVREHIKLDILIHAYRYYGQEMVQFSAR